MRLGAEGFVMALWDCFIFLYVHVFRLWVSDWLVTMFDMANGKSSMFQDFLEEKQTNMRPLSFPTTSWLFDNLKLVLYL